MEHLGRPSAQATRVAGNMLVTKDNAHSFNIRFFHDKGRDYRRSRFPDFSLEEAMNADCNEAVASYIQSWLYFGLLNEIFLHICGIDFDWGELVRVEGGCNYSVINTEKLDMFIYLWHVREADASATEKFKRLDRITRLLIKADNIVSLMQDALPRGVPAEMNLDDPGAPGYPIMAAVILSVKVLGMTLCEALPTVYSNFMPRPGAEYEPLYCIDTASTYEKLLKKVEFHSSYTRDPIVSELLKRAGYCPYQVATCDRDYRSQGNLGLRWFLTFLNRRGIPGDHSSCTTRKCVGYHVDEKTYETKHYLDRDCDCQTISLSHGYERNMVLDCIQQGGTPLIRVDSPGIRIFRMGIAAEGPAPPYVAISHVWSEGMGNPRENALPECQLRVLQYAADSSCPGMNNVHFWIDTLCIPVGHEKERRQEIKKMASIYEGAEKTVVYDRSLMEASSNSSREEVLIRIWKSPWASRLWTLQEGRLSKSLSFFFADKFYELKFAGLENAESWHLAIHYQTDLPSWVCRYENLGDQTCYAMIECGSQLGDPGCKAALRKIQKHSTLSHMAQCSQEGEGKQVNRSQVQGNGCEGSPSSLPRSFISRIDRYNKYRAVRYMAFATFQSFGSLHPSQIGSICQLQFGDFHPSHPVGLVSTKADLFRSVLAQLTTRGLTRPEDEAVCLATTIGVDLEPIFKAKSSEERMRIFLTSMDILPLGILFVDSERLRMKYCRWVPRTLLCQGPKYALGSLRCQSDGRLLYNSLALMSTRPFAIAKTCNYFAAETEDGKKYFIGIQPQPGLKIDDEAKTYLIIPSHQPLSRDSVPQRVAVISLSAKKEAKSVESQREDLQTQYEFTAWHFEFCLPGDERLHIGSVEPGQYSTWQADEQHRWNIDVEDEINGIPFTPIAEDQKVLIG